MKIEGAYTFGATREEVWTAILDADVLSRTLPGGQDLEEIGENEYKAKMKMRVGPVQGVFSGTVKLSDIRPLEGYHIELDGKGAPGFVKGEGELRLEAQGDSTILNYNGEAQVGGRLASVGQRLMESSAKALVRQSLEALDAQIAARQNGAEAEALPPPVEAPSELEFAAGVTRKMLDDMFPADQRQELLRAGFIIVTTLFVLGAIANWWMNRLADRVADRIEKRR